MADDKVIDNGSLSDFTIATDEIAGKDYQYVKLVSGTLDSTEKIEGTAANGLEVDVTRIAAGTKIQLTDGTSDATVRNLAANDALNVAIVDGAGGHVTSFGGSGGTSSSDDADFTQLTTPGTPGMGVYESTPTSVTDNDMGIIGIDVNRRVKVSVDASTLDVAHDATDSGNPVLTGSRGLSAMPAAVSASGDRTRSISDMYGRKLVSHIDLGMQVWKSFNATTTQTGAVIWAPTAGKKIAITSFIIGTYATTAARLIMYLGTAADTTYTAGTDQLIFAGSFAPSATVKPGAVVTLPTPMYAVTADHNVHITTDAALSVDVTMYGYEF